MSLEPKHSGLQACLHIEVTWEASKYLHLYPASRYCDLIGLQCGLGVGIFKSSLDDSEMQVDLGAVTCASHLVGVPVMLTE